MHFHLAITNALLPQPVREIYGFDWSHRQQRAFDLSARSLRFVLPRLPAQLRELPITRRMIRGETRKEA
ncbi:MAG: oxygenase MpaB family protein, partial [Ktedonobacteraceae bacterium]